MSIFSVSIGVAVIGWCILGVRIMVLPVGDKVYAWLKAAVILIGIVVIGQYIHFHYLVDLTLNQGYPSMLTLWTSIGFTTAIGLISIVKGFIVASEYEHYKTKLFKENNR